VVVDIGSLVEVAEVYTIPHLHLVRVEVQVDLTPEGEMAVEMKEILDLKTLVVEEVDLKGKIPSMQVVMVVLVLFSSHIHPN
tara:strand:- start:29 stop:274 length:246 start_codon:yes stop_codon:yes gene_type:complete